MMDRKITPKIITLLSFLSKVREKSLRCLGGTRSLTDVHPPFERKEGRPHPSDLFKRKDKTWFKYR